MNDERNNDGSASPSKPWQFQPGNPGRRTGCRNKATLAALALLEGEAEALTRRCIELALAGDPTAMKLVLDRVLPKGRAPKIRLPMRTLAELDQATGVIGYALAEGQVSLDEVGQLSALVEARRRVIATTELERRLVALEAAQGEQG